MVNINKILLSIICLIFIISSVFALPVTQAATAIGSNNATISMVGGVAPMWFMWGQRSDSLSWLTENSTLSTYTLYGSPLLGNTQFYYKACDSTGCDANTMSFTTLQITPQPQTTFGISVDNMTRSHFGVDVVSSESIKAYFWLIPTFPTIVWGLLFFGIYIGLWIRERDLVVPVILGLITGSFVMFNDVGLQLGIPVEFQSIAQGLTYAALAGIILTWVKRS